MRKREGDKRHGGARRQTKTRGPNEERKGERRGLMRAGKREAVK